MGLLYVYNMRMRKCICNINKDVIFEQVGLSNVFF